MYDVIATIMTLTTGGWAAGFLYARERALASLTT
jgi:hypothetical protein